MIRINLLPVREARKRESVKVQLAIGAIVMLVTLGCLYAWYATMDNMVETTKGQISAAEQRVRELEKIIGKVSNIKSVIQLYEEKMRIIEDLKAKKSGPIQLLDELSMLIPAKVWLTKLEQGGEQFSLEGQAITNEDLVQFLKALRNSKLFDNVMLKFSEQKAAQGDNKGGMSFVNFALSCTARLAS